MDTELLKTFLEVRNTRHFGRAAENLHITQAAVSARIRQLEELLGVRLFLRKRNNLRLSREGERLVPHAETVLLAWWRGRQAVSPQGEAGRQVFLGLRAGLWTPPLQQKLGQLQLAMPDLALRVDVQRADTALRMLLDGTLDAALLGEAPRLTELQGIELGELSLRLFSSGNTGSLKRALEEDYVYLDWGQDFDRFHSLEFGERLAPALRTNLRELALDYLSRERACVYLPVSMKADLADAGIGEVRGAPKMNRRIELVFNSASVQLALVESLAQQLSGLKL